nr:hypothetical protein CFP56_45440 [Quercus suber]
MWVKWPFNDVLLLEYIIVKISTMKESFLVEGRGFMKFLPLLLSQMKTMLAYKSWNTKQNKSMPDGACNRRSKGCTTLVCVFKPEGPLLGGSLFYLIELKHRLDDLPQKTNTGSDRSNDNKNIFHMSS